jgi:hypothetical protein
VNIATTPRRLVEEFLKPLRGMAERRRIQFTGDVRLEQEVAR